LGQAKDKAAPGLGSRGRGVGGKSGIKAVKPGPGWGYLAFFTFSAPGLAAEAMIGFAFQKLGSWSIQLCGG
jgi:hypothetical protein